MVNNAAECNVICGGKEIGEVIFFVGMCRRLWKLVNQGMLDVIVH